MRRLREAPAVRRVESMVAASSVEVSPWFGWAVDRCKRPLPLLATGLATLIALHRLGDWDTWWHLAAGRWITVHRSIPRTDTLTFTTGDQPWLNLQWLYDVGLYGLYQVGGANALVVSAALAFGIAIGMLVGNSRRSLGPVGTAIMALWVTVIAQERFEVRPEMVSFVLVQVMVWLFATAGHGGGRRLWLLPVVMLFWVNTHALFGIGLFFVACHMLSAVLVHLSWVPAGWRGSSSQPPIVRARVLASGAVTLLMPLLNPYGLSGALFPLQLLAMVDTSSAAYQSIAELHPPFSDYFPTLAVYAYRPFFVLSLAVVGLTAVLLAVSHRRPLQPAAGGPNPNRAARRRGAARVDTASDQRSANPAEGLHSGNIDIADLLIFCGLAYLSLLARRNIALFAVSVAPFVARCLFVLRSRAPRALQHTWEVAAAGIAVILLPAMIAAGWLIVSNRFYRWDLEAREFGTGVLEVNFPVRAAAFIKELRFPPQLYNDIAAGGYLAWSDPIDAGVYIDGRLGLGDTKFFSAYVAASNTPDLWQQDADRFGIRTVVLFYRGGTIRQPLIRWLLSNPRWALVYFDEAAIVFLRRDDNDELIVRARAQFAQWTERITADLATPVSSWQWPVARALALSNYAAVLEAVGAGDSAVEYYARFLELDPHPKAAAQAHLHLAYLYVGKGDLAAARAHLALAAAGDPRNSRVRELQTRLGS